MSPKFMDLTVKIVKAAFIVSLVGDLCFGQSVDYPSEPATAFCKSEEFKNLKCGFASDQEIAATEEGQCYLCGSAFSHMPDLPRTIDHTDSGLAFYELYAKALSLACKGKVLVRSVFKIEFQPDVPEQHGKNCSWARLSSSPGTGAGIPVVRCLLDLPQGPGTEVERAIKAKETSCYFCGYCTEGSGCPGTTGVWYSDSYVTTSAGCDFDANTGYNLRGSEIYFQVNPKAKVLVAAHYACNDPDCFDQTREAEKLRTAKPCLGGKCPA